MGSVCKIIGGQDNGIASILPLLFLAVGCCWDALCIALLNPLFPLLVALLPDLENRSESNNCIII